MEPIKRSNRPLIPGHIRYRLHQNIDKANDQTYKLMIQMSPDAIAIHSNGIIIFANKEAAKLIGVKCPEKLMGMRSIDLVHHDYHRAVKKYMLELQKKCSFPHPILVKLVRMDGSLIDVEMNATRLPDKDKFTFFTTIRYAYNHKYMNESICDESRILNHCTEYDRLKSEFFANISHEFRTPLNIILGLLQLLDLDYKSALGANNSQNVDRNIRVMKQNCCRLLKLVTNLIDLTKIDAGSLYLNLENCNIVQIIENITLSSVQYAENKGLTLIFDTDVEEKIIACDPEKIERIMLNLLSNAIKFTLPGGSIFVNIYDSHKSIKISVKDTGIGVPQDMLDMIFEKFVQVDRLLTRNHDGIGVGLSLVKSLTEMHKGKVSVKSELGVGSEFIVELPVRLLSHSKETSQHKTGQILQDQPEMVHIEFSDIYIEG